MLLDPYFNYFLGVFNSSLIEANLYPILRTSSLFIAIYIDYSYNFLS